MTPLLILAVPTFISSQPQYPSILPKPLRYERLSGSFAFNKDTKISAPDELIGVVHYLQDQLRPPTGLELERSRRGNNGDIQLRLDRRQAVLGEEGYRLHVTPQRIEVIGFQPAGVFLGLQTLRQLMPIENYRRSAVKGVDWTVPAVRIEDKPRFSWRGGHLDVGRHFMPKEFVLKTIDLLAMHKFNTLHLHLTEDQGWRMEIKRYPKLTEVGAWRKRTMLKYDPATYEERPHGGYYTQVDLREIVAYAKTRFINVVPEIEMPGHARAAIASYPELGNLPNPIEVGDRWGVYDDVFNVEDSTIEFLKNVLDEVLEIFPSKFIHIGGDECPKMQWQSSPKAQAKMKALGLKDEHELQSWFVRQIDDYLTAKGRRLVGWDEILEGGLAKGATVMSWRGMDGGIAAAKSGHDVIMAPTSHTYFDYYQSKDHSTEPHAIGGFVPLEKVFEFEPIPAQLSEQEATHVLGGQFQIWTEYIRNPKAVEYMSYPRACALAETLWSAKNGRDFKEFSTRLRDQLERLQILDVNYRRDARFLAKEE